MLATPAFAPRVAGRTDSPFATRCPQVPAVSTFGLGDRWPAGLRD